MFNIYERRNEIFNSMGEYWAYAERVCVQSAALGNFDCFINKPLEIEDETYLKLISKFCSKDIKVIQSNNTYEIENNLRNLFIRVFDKINHRLSHISPKSTEFADKENILVQAKLTLDGLFCSLVPFESKYRNLYNKIDLIEWDKAISLRSDDLEFMANNKSFNKTFLIPELELISNDLKEAYLLAKNIDAYPKNIKKLKLYWIDYSLEMGIIDSLLDPFLLNWLSSISGQGFIKKIIHDIQKLSGTQVLRLNFEKTLGQARFGNNKVYKVFSESNKYGIIPFEPNLFLLLLPLICDFKFFFKHNEDSSIEINIV